MNLHYQSPEIERFYSQHRMRWADFYPSERVVFERVAKERGSMGSVLDVGGAVGGLGRALAERFGSVQRYTCVDINPQAIATAEAWRGSFPGDAEFLCADIVARPPALVDREFDLVACLSCADWNLEPNLIIHTCWRHVAPGGRLVISLRLTDAESINDMSRSYQYIHFGEGPPPPDAERANYVVLNFREACTLLNELSPARIYGFGYWGKPSTSAVTRYDRIVFAVFAVHKGDHSGPAAAELELPLDFFATAHQ